MRSSKKVLCSFLVVMALAFASPAFSAIRIGVDTFRNGASNIDPGVARSLTEMFITELSKSGVFQVFERTQLEAVAREQRLSMSGQVSPETLVKVGRLAGVEWIITGAVTEFTEANEGIAYGKKNFGIALGNYRGTVTIDIRTIDTTTGAVTASLRQQGVASRSTSGVAYEGFAIGGSEHGGVGAQAAMKAVKKAVRELERRLGGVEYHVIKHDRKRPLIDVGSVNGAAKGDLYAVYAEGKPIRDHKGNILDTEKLYYALLKVVDVKPNYSACAYVAEKGGPGAIREGDLIEPIDPGAQARGLQITKREMPKHPPIGGAPGKGGMPPAHGMPPAPGEGGPIFRPQPGVDVNNCTDANLIKAYNAPDGVRRNTEILFNNGMKFYKAGNYRKAYDMFARADSPSDVLNTYWAGMSALKIGDRKNARKWLEKALQMHPDYVPAQKALKQVK